MLLEEIVRFPGAHVVLTGGSSGIGLAKAFAGATDQGGPCDVLITSAGQARPGRFLELGDEVFRRMIEVDYFGTLYAVRAVAPEMVRRRTGSIVAISSAAGLLGIYGYSAYGPAKFAVRGPRRLRVPAVCGNATTR